MKKIALSLVQPGYLLAILLFWTSAPAAWSEGPVAVIGMAFVIMGSILALEWFSERHASWRITRREFATDLFYVILGVTAISWLTITLAEDPLKAARTSLGITTEWVSAMPFVLQVALVIFLIEFGQYWMHRLMHKNYAFWLTHSPHHHLTQLNAMKGAVGNPIELFLISLSVVVLFDVPLAAVFCAGNMLGAIASFAHANVRTYPPKWYSFVFTTIEHHSLHHSAKYEDNFCNYGNSLILLDRVFGTYRDGAAETVGQGERIKLSIREQFMFPFVPLIERIKGRRAPDAAG
jgi:sterol desaturase/sphingolipid hydroxylase (fatty acid hydroxylase superfamily)